MSREPWTDSRVDLLTRLWRDGLSASEISARLGVVTRNAVLGKVHRLGLSASRPPPPARPKPTRTPRQPRTVPRVTPAPPAPTIVDEGPGAVTDLLGLGPHMCRWPIGDPKAADFSFCGAGCRGAYCARHRRLAYVRRRARRAPMGLAAWPGALEAAEG